MTDLLPDIVELAPYVPPTAGGGSLTEVAFRKTAWLPAEIATLRAMFAEDATVDEIAAEIGRGRAGVGSKIAELGLRRNSRRPWTELEDAAVARRYGEESAAAIAQDLGRGAKAVYCRAKLLGLSDENPPPWTEWEDLQMRAGYAAGVPVADVAALIGRPYYGLTSRASKLGIKHAAAPPDWSAEETARALELAHEGLRYRAIMVTLAEEGFPERTKSGFGRKLRLLGYGRGWGRRWTPDEDELLRRAYATGGNLRRLASELSRTPGSLRYRGEELDLRGKHPNPNGWRGEVWSAEDEAKLRQLYGTMKNKDLAKVLNRSLRSVNTRANVLKLPHPWMRAFTPDEDRAIAIAWRHGVSLNDLAGALERQLRVVWKHSLLLGLCFSDPNRPARPRRTWRRNRGSPPLTLTEILAMEGARPASPPAGARRQALPSSFVGPLLSTMSDDSVALICERSVAWVRERRAELFLEVAA